MTAALSPSHSSYWSACPCCGLLQELPPPERGHQRICQRCHTPFGRGIISLSAALAFAITTLCLFAIAQCYPLMTMRLEGQSHSAVIATGVSGLQAQEFSSLALLVLIIAIAAPLLRIVSLFWVIVCLYFKQRPLYLARLFRISQRLREWTMLDVCLLGAVIALSKLHKLAQIDVGIGFWGLGFVVISLIMLERTFNAQAIWDAIYPPLHFDVLPDTQHCLSCEVCELLQPVSRSQTFQKNACKRCGASLHHRKPESLSKTWALVIAGFILYIPANAYPVMTVISFGREEPSTILSGVQQLLTGNDWPLAVIVFTASIIIPLLKLLGFVWLMLAERHGSSKYLMQRTKLYRIIRVIGRWSNVDIFVAALLTGLVTLGNIATVEPGKGAIAFGAVVVLTMFATESFDPRLMWDAAEKTHGR